MFRCSTRATISRKRILLRYLIIVAAFLIAGQGAAETLAGRASVIDGDTIELHDQRIRLHGIDAPEGGQTCQTAAGKQWRCGTAAARALDGLTFGKTVVCAPQDTDRYGRIVAICKVAGLDLGRDLVEKGLAVAYRSYSRAYVQAEGKARSARRGIWAGRFQMPWDWRRAN